MATLVLGAVGAAIGGSIGGAILGVSAATIGGFIGSSIGSVVDSWIISSLAPTQRIEGARLDTLRITSATEGAVIPKLYGRMRMGGNIIWATDFREETKTTTQGGGKGGGGGKVKTTEYLYYASFAVALCQGPITGIGRIWADGKPMDLSGVTWRWYPGDEAQTADPFIAAKMGAANTPAYRGTAYVVFEELALSTYGNRLPQLSFEVFRPLADPDTAEGLTRAVTMIPASGEFTYATQAIRKTDGGATVPENLNALADSTDMVEALDRLQAIAPAVESVSLVVAWFGDDLRAGSCKVRPGVEVSAKSTTPASWSVNGVNRGSAFLVSRDEQDRPVYGGTPSDFSVVQAIQEMKARGLRVTFYPFILMDVPPGNPLPNPYSNNAAETGQPAFPWRGRITCSPAAGFAGTVDKTATAASQVAALFGAATPASFSVSGQSVSWTGPSGDWGLRRMVLYYAHLCAAAGAALCLPFVTEVWQVYVLIFLLQSASAAFTPTFQATIPDVLPEEARYTRALSLSRLAYDLENIVSPTLAALLLAVMSYNSLFLGTVVGFAASALLVVSVLLPSPKPSERRGIYDRTTRGIRIYLATPRLRGLLALNLAAAAAGAMVLVNSVVLVRGTLGLSESALAWTMFAFGAGSMLAALLLPRLLDRVPDRPVMVAGAALMVLSLLVLAAEVAALGLDWPFLLGAWLLVGLGYSAVLTPSGRLLRRSAHAEDRPALFAAQFALSHACWLVTYPLSGWLMTQFGPVTALGCLAALAGAGALTALRLWPKEDPDVLEHTHENLPLDHPHLKGERRHAHPFVVDDQHPRWGSQL